ncbi:MAG: glycosyltransferase [Candidatus Glassbacteria bacterium]
MGGCSDRRESPDVKIAYIFGGFPYYSQTFNMEEIRGLIEKGLEVLVFSVIRPRGYQSMISHSSFRMLEDAIIYCPSPFSLGFMKSQAYYLTRKPHLYLWLYIYIALRHGRKVMTMLKTLLFLPVAFHYARLIEEHGVSLVHAGMSRYAATYALIISRITGLPFSFTMHGPKSFLRGAMHREKMKRARFVTTISEFNRNLLGEYTDGAGLEKIHVIRVGIDIDKFPFRHPSGKTNGLSVLSVARLDMDKGLDYLIRAVAGLQGKIEGLSLTLVGDGPARGYLEQLTGELGVRSKVHFAGALEHDEVVKEYRKADAFVLPSFWEGIPVVLIEAMASGVPVVATRITGIPELISDGQNGILVRAGESEALASALLTLYENPSLRERFSLSSRKKVEEEYSVTKRTEKLYALFTTCGRRE